MEKSILYKGLPVFYTISGKGTCLVLLHGFAEDSRIWKYQQAELEKHVMLIVPDLPGSGQSALPKDVSMESQADTIKAILDHEQVFSCVMIGHSMGGYITLAFAEKYPAFLRAWGLFHSTAYPDTEEKKVSRNKSVEFIEKHGSYAFLQQSSPNTFSERSRTEHEEKVEMLINNYKDANPQALIAYYRAMMQRPDRTSVLSDSKVPVLFVIGQHDNAIPFNDGLKQSHVPVFSYIYILEESGHMGIWEEPEKSNRILLQFIKDVST